MWLENAPALAHFLFADIGNDPVISAYAGGLKGVD
jgi:hypothetical protein